MEIRALKQIQDCLAHFPQGHLSSLQKVLLLLGIHYLHYVKIYNDGSRISLSTHPDFIYDFFKHNLYEKHFLHNHTNRLDNLAVCWRNMIEPTNVRELRSERGVGNDGFSIVRKHEDYHQIYHFATHDQTIIQELTTTKVNLIYHFINYFHSEYKELIYEQEAYKFKLAISQDTQHANSNTLVQTFLDKTKLKNYHILDSNEKLTTKELNVLTYVCQGLSNKEIADNLCRSIRTVESHIDSLKSKLGCRNVKSLMKSVTDDDLLRAELELNNRAILN